MMVELWRSVLTEAAGAGVWTLVLIAAVPSALSLTGSFLMFRLTASEKVLDRDQAVEAARIAELARREASMNARDKEVVDWLRTDAERYRLGVIEAEKSADYWAHIARLWETLCHKIKHQRDNERAMVNGLLAQRGLQERKWRSDPLPALEEIVTFSATDERRPEQT